MADNMETATATVVTMNKSQAQPGEGATELPLIVPHSGNWRPDSSVTREKKNQLRKESLRKTPAAAPTRPVDDSKLTPSSTPAPVVPPSSITTSHPSTPAQTLQGTPLNPAGPRPIAVYPQHLMKEVRKVAQGRTLVGINRPNGFVSQGDRLKVTLKDIEEGRSRNGFDGSSHRSYSTYTLRPRQFKVTVSANNLKLESRKGAKEAQHDVLRVPQNSAGSERINYRNINLKRFYDALDYAPSPSVSFSSPTQSPLPRYTRRATRKGVLKTGKLYQSRREMPKPQATHRVGHIRNALETMTEKGPAVNIERVLALRLYNDLEEFRRTKTLLTVAPSFSVPSSGLFKIQGDPTLGELALEEAKKDLTVPMKRSSTSMSKKSSQSEPIFPALSSMKFVSSRRGRTPEPAERDLDREMPEVRGRSPDSAIRAVKSSNSLKRSPLPTESMDSHRGKTVMFNEVGAS